jgi:hypothetical protein
MHEVLQVLVTRNECQHVMMERYFKSPSFSRVYEPCRAKCTQCTKDLNLLRGRICRSKLTQMLISFSSGQMQATAASIKSIKTTKKDIFGGSVPTRGMGIHALCLQLVAHGIIHLGICGNKKALYWKERVKPKECHCEVGNS